MSKSITLTSSERTTLQMALSCWIIRCDSEAKQMREWAEDMPHHAAKCIANAEASERLAVEARALSNTGKL